MADILIKAGRSEDAEAVQDVIRTAYATWAEALPDLPDVSAGVADDIAASRVWVAIRKGEIVGCLIGGHISEHWHVANVAVAPKHGGEGIGRALMEYAVSQARREGVTEMVLATHRDMPGNVALYEKLGWQVSGEVGNKIMMRRNTDR